MGNLEERFFTIKQVTLIHPRHQDAPLICKILGKCLKKGDFVLDCGRPAKYIFDIGRLYD